MTKKICINGNNLTLDSIVEISEGASISIDHSVKKRVEKAAEFVQTQCKLDKPIYGVNTGFGYFANKKIPHDKLEELQLNLIKSHAGGYGCPLPANETRLAMALRLNVLAKGYTGVRYCVLEGLLNLIQKEIYPVIPEFGSLGASGDLAPLAHLALPLVGLGRVSYKDQVIPAREALKQAGLKPLQLKEKEGLGLINGTQIMLAVGSLALAKSRHLLTQADRITALSYEGSLALTAPLDQVIHHIRNQAGQIASAKRIRDQLDGSFLFEGDFKGQRVQDPYSLRCAPQVHGASQDTVDFATQVVERELNAATDNPLVFPEENKIVSGGNFHGQPLAFAYDFTSIAIAEIGNISERRIEALLNPHISGLPAFLTPEEGINSGYMILQYLAGSLVNENKLLANPASTDSIPGNVGIEDHVSMGMTSARKLKKIVNNVEVILAIEALVATQAIDLRKHKKLGKGTSKTYDAVRSSVPKLTNDRIVSEDLQKILEVIYQL